MAPYAPPKGWYGVNSFKTRHFKWDEFFLGNSIRQPCKEPLAAQLEAQHGSLHYVNDGIS